MQFRGIQDVEVGYAGGHTQNPGYEAVCSETTGHAEVARVIFDPAIIPAETVLDIFFTLHDPTQLNRQGNDVGTQYRSAMFYEDDLQKALFEEAIARADSLWDGGIVTTLEPLRDFYTAEDYHQDYYKKSPQDYYAYRKGSGRDAFIQKHWPELTAKKYPAPSKNEL
jgi:peptide-methionine (S)-S-oxide reductase